MNENYDEIIFSYSFAQVFFSFMSNFYVSIIVMRMMVMVWGGGGRDLLIVYFFLVAAQKSC
jgi:hypothetical protein